MIEKDTPQTMTERFIFVKWASGPLKYCSSSYYLYSNTSQTPPYNHGTSSNRSPSSFIAASRPQRMGPVA